MAENKIISHLKNKWGIKTTWSFIAINLTFAAAGMSVLYAKKFIFQLIGVPEDASFWLKSLLFLIIVFPLYQVFLFFWGFIFGHYKFFLQYKKKMFKFLFGFKRFFQPSKTQ